MAELYRVAQELVSWQDSGADSTSVIAYLRHPSIIETICSSALGIDHLLGFTQLRLGTVDGRHVRIHFWNYPDTNIDDVHSHAWGFQSTILQGTITNCLYEITEADDGPKELQVVRYADQSSSRIPIKRRAYCEKLHTDKYQHGDNYELEAANFHVSRVITESAVTLLITDGQAGISPLVVGEREAAEIPYPIYYSSSNSRRNCARLLDSLGKSKLLP